MIDVILLPQNGCTEDVEFGCGSWTNTTDYNFFGIRAKLPCLPKSHNIVHLSDVIRKSTLADWKRQISSVKRNDIYPQIFKFLDEYVHKEMGVTKHYTDEQALEFFVLGNTPDGEIDEDAELYFENVEILDIDGNDAKVVVFDTEKNVVYIPCRFMY